MQPSDYDESIQASSVPGTQPVGAIGIDYVNGFMLRIELNSVKHRDAETPLHPLHHKCVTLDDGIKNLETHHVLIGRRRSRLALAFTGQPVARCLIEVVPQVIQ
eukprot:3507892-Amphidinium_carterae.1